MWVPGEAPRLWLDGLSHRWRSQETRDAIDCVSFKGICWGWIVSLRSLPTSVVMVPSSGPELAAPPAPGLAAPTLPKPKAIVRIQMLEDLFAEHVASVPGER